MGFAYNHFDEDDDEEDPVEFEKRMLKFAYEEMASNPEGKKELLKPDAKKEEQKTEAKDDDDELIVTKSKKNK